MDDATPERWLPVPGYDFYEVSDFGCVRSVRHWTPQGHRGGRTLKASLTSAGRPAVTLVQDGKRTRMIHQLVAYAFLGPCPEGQEVRHLDGDPLNNVLDNLAYGTRSQNQFDAVLHGTHSKARNTHCTQGHEYTPENTYIPPGRNDRNCITCRTARDAGRSHKGAKAA